MFTINFDPAMLKLGFFEIRWYSIIFLLGFILAYLWFRRISKKGWIENFDLETVDELVIYLILGVVIGSRIFYFIFYDFRILIDAPFEFFKVWHGGLSFHGGLIGVILSVILFSKIKKINVWKIFDATAVVAILALAFGRIGNLMNSDLVGTPFNGAWCAVFTRYDSVCRHPYPIYAFISHLVLFSVLALLLYLNRKNIKEFIGEKVLSTVFLTGYGVLRITADIWKQDDILFGIKTGQWLSIGMIVAGIGILVYDYIKNEKVKEQIS